MFGFRFFCLFGFCCFCLFISVLVSIYFFVFFFFQNLLLLLAINFVFSYFLVIFTRGKTSKQKGKENSDKKAKENEKKMVDGSYFIPQKKKKTYSLKIVKKTKQNKKQEERK